MIKCIVCDLDGTLIKPDDTIEENTLELLKRCIDSGIDFIVATGRDIHMVREFLGRVDINCDLVLNNGTQYRDLDGTFNEIHPMDKNSFIKIAHILKDYNYLLAIHTDQGKYSFHDKEEFWDYHIKLLLKGKHYAIKEEQLPDKVFTTRRYLLDLHYASTPEEIIEKGVNVLKIDARHLEVDDVEKVRDLLEIEYLDISSSYADNIEITTNSYNKAIMLKEVVRKKGYNVDEVAVFGDGYNDVDMLKVFEYSFAPANACPPAKEIARVVLNKDVLEGAVGEGIEYLLKEELIKLS